MRHNCRLVRPVRMKGQSTCRHCSVACESCIAQVAHVRHEGRRAAPSRHVAGLRSPSLFRLIKHFRNFYVKTGLAVILRNTSAVVSVVLAPSGIAECESARGVGVVLTSNSDMRSGQEFHRMLLDIQTIRGSSPVMERRLYYRIFQNSDTQTFACMTECVDSCAAKFLTIDRDPQRSFFI